MNNVDELKESKVEVDVATNQKEGKVELDVTIDPKEGTVEVDVADWKEGKVKVDVVAERTTLISTWGTTLGIFCTQCYSNTNLIKLIDMVQFFSFQYWFVQF